MVPQVETVEDARHITSAAKFGANINGTRSVPPARFMPGLSDIVLQSDKTLWQNLNDQAAIIIQIESLRAIINLDDILTECGDHIDSVWLGSLDARASMGLPGMSGTEPEWLAAVATFDAALRKHDKPYSGFSIPGPPEVMKAAGERKSMLAIGTDISGLMMQIDVLNDARKNFPIRNYSAENKGPGFDAQINENKKTE
jgi:4-hydroxy-2-oxoheptanedioate aldolase